MLLNEENNETLISLKAKRSRLLTTNDTAITTDNQNPSMLADITKQCTTSSASPHTHGCLTNTSFFIGRSWRPGLSKAMNVISWNWRDLGNVKAVPSLKDLVRVYKADIVILIETSVHGDKIDDLCYNMGFDNHFFVDKIGRIGGLVVLWRNNINCSLLNYAQNFINLLIRDPTDCNLEIKGFLRVLRLWETLRILGPVVSSQQTL